MSKTDRREILSRVAAGTISPEEAASQLDAVTPDETESEPAIRRVRVIKQLGPAEIIGDPNVREAVAEGQHRARIEGDTMIIEGQSVDDWGGFIFGAARSAGRDRLVVRVNPALSLDLELQAGNCRVSGVEGPIRANVQAGSATIEGFSKTIDLSVQAGSVRATGRLDEGDSRIACDAGSVNLHLERGSSVRVTTRVNLGKVNLPVGTAFTAGRGTQDLTIGDGAASLAITTSMGSVNLTADQ
jgi:hypothetical protein